MRQPTVAALAASALVSASVPILASGDREEFEEACREAAMYEGVATKQIAGFIVDCVAANLATREEDDAEEMEEREKTADVMTAGPE